MKKEEKTLSYYLNLDYPFVINKETDEGKTYYAAEIPDLPGCGAHGETIGEAISSLEKAKKLWIEVSLEKNLDIPEPVSEEEYSGKFILRIPPKLHMELSKNAEKNNLSLNQFIRKTLENNMNLNELVKRIDKLEKWFFKENENKDHKKSQQWEDQNAQSLAGVPPAVVPDENAAYGGV